LAQKQFTGILAPVERWLNGVTDKDLVKGAAIVTLTGIFGGAAYISAGRIQLPVAGMGGTFQAIAFVGILIATMLGWVISSLIYHALAHLLGGKGDRNRMFALAGYSSLPALTQQAIRLVEYWLGGTSLQTSTIPELLLDHFNVFALIGLVLVGVSVMLNYGISGRKAALVALTPNVLTLLFGLWSLRAAGAAASAGQGGGLLGVRRLL
jgi:hypothetical protein